MPINWTNLQKKYRGKWLALASDERTVLGAGNTAKEALKKAKDKSMETPFLTRMPKKIVAYVGLA